MSDGRSDAGTIHADTVTPSDDGYVTRFSRRSNRDGDGLTFRSPGRKMRVLLVELHVSDGAGVAQRQDARQQNGDESGTKLERHGAKSSTTAHIAIAHCVPV